MNIRYLNCCLFIVMVFLVLCGCNFNINDGWSTMEMPRFKIADFVANNGLPYEMSNSRKAIMECNMNLLQDKRSETKNSQIEEFICLPDIISFRIYKDKVVEYHLCYVVQMQDSSLFDATFLAFYFQRNAKKGYWDYYDKGNLTKTGNLSNVYIEILQEFCEKSFGAAIRELELELQSD